MLFSLRLRPAAGPRLRLRPTVGPPAQTAKAKFLMFFLLASPKAGPKPGQCRAKGEILYVFAFWAVYSAASQTLVMLCPGRLSLVPHCAPWALYGQPFPNMAPNCHCGAPQNLAWGSPGWTEGGQTQTWSHRIASQANAPTGPAWASPSDPQEDEILASTICLLPFRWESLPGDSAIPIFLVLVSSFNCLYFFPGPVQLPFNSLEIPLTTV